MGVVPEKPDGSADHGAAEDGEFADHGHALEFEVVGKDDVAADVGEHGERAGGDDGAADGQAVETVGEVNGVGGAHEHEDYECDEGHKDEEFQVRNGTWPQVPQQVGTPALDERHGQLRGEHFELRQDNEGDGDGCAGDSLPEELGAGGKAEAAAVDDLDVVVSKADCAEGEGGEHGEPHKGIGGVGPEYRGQQDGDDDEYAAHGGGA